MSCTKPQNYKPKQETVSFPKKYEKHLFKKLNKKDTKGSFELVEQCIQCGVYKQTNRQTFRVLYFDFKGFPIDAIPSCVHNLNMNRALERFGQEVPVYKTLDELIKD